MAVVNWEVFRRTEKLKGLPYVIKIEPTNICNSTCRLCPTGQGICGRAKGRMSYEQFCRVVDQVKRHAYVVDLSNWGDPLLVADIYKMIRYTHEAGIWTYISSNLHAFHVESGDAEAMVRSGLDMLNCSLHGVTQETYEKYQPGKDLAGTLEKIRAIVETKRKLGSRTPVVQLFYVVTKQNEHEIEAFKRLAEELDCVPVFTTASLNLRFVGKDKHLNDLGWTGEQKKQAIETLKREWLPVNSQWVSKWYQETDGRSKETAGEIKPYRCDWPWRSTVINWDGAVTVCCGDYDPQWEVGNIFHESLKTIWNNEIYRAARRSFVKAEACGVGEPCKSCLGVLR
jgi:radical SAM protein with 4Fe4S-binding SPASM domain